MRFILSIAMFLGLATAALSDSFDVKQHLVQSTDVPAAIVQVLPPLLTEDARPTVEEILVVYRANPDRVEDFATGFVTVVRNAIIANNSRLADAVTFGVNREGGELARLFNEKLKASFSNGKGAFVLPIPPFSTGSKIGADVSPASL